MTPTPAATTDAEVVKEDRMVVLRCDERGKPTVWCDPEIADLVDLLNSGDIATVASCSGHGHRPGFIALRGGRYLMVFENMAQARSAELSYPLDINGERQSLPECRQETEVRGWTDWIHPLPGYLMQCCDCGLTHEFQFAIGDAPPPFNPGEGPENVILYRARRLSPPSSAPALEGLREALSDTLDPYISRTFLEEAVTKVIALLASPNTETAGERG